MADDQTHNMTLEQKIDRILADVATLKSDVATLKSDVAVLKEDMSDLKLWRGRVDAFIEDRSRDTRPKLDLIHKDVADIRDEIVDIRRELKLFREELWQEKKERADLDNRLSRLEKQPA